MTGIHPFITYDPLPPRCGVPKSNRRTSTTGQSTFYTIQDILIQNNGSLCYMCFVTRNMPLFTAISVCIAKCLLVGDWAIRKISTFFNCRPICITECMDIMDMSLFNESEPLVHFARTWTKRIRFWLYCNVVSRLTCSGYLEQVRKYIRSG
jgi:hypothetical protein